MIVVFDSSFLMAVAEHPTQWEEDIDRLVGPARRVVLRCTVEELELISRKRSGKSRWAASALELSKKFTVEPSGEGRVDDEIVSFALGGPSAVATVDGELVSALKARRVPVVGLRRGRVAIL